jgi:hypothetical protein
MARRNDVEQRIDLERVVDPMTEEVVCLRGEGGGAEHDGVQDEDTHRNGSCELHE